MMKYIFIFSAFLILGAGGLSAQSRGVWFWGSTTLPGGSASPWGSNDVVGDPVLEDDCLAFFKLHHVTRVYGSYGTRPVTQQATIAAWNEKLDCLRIESQMLLSGAAVTTTADIDVYLGKITSRLTDFNDVFAAEPSKQFDALHLDLEPQQLAAFTGGSSAVRRIFLDDLLNCYTQIRLHLNSKGYPDFPIYADIPFTWDKFPGSIGWVDAADRDDWFLDLKNVLTGLSIMTFSKDSAPELDAASAYERAGALDGFSRIGFQPKVGIVDPPNIIWSDYPTFLGVLDELEDLVEEDETTDIENLGYWRHAIETTGLGFTLRNRGLWFWEYNPFDHATVHIHSSLSVVGHAIRENEAVNFMASRQVRALFGEYSDRPENEPAVLAAWNAKLHAAHIDSQSFLVSTGLTLIDKLVLLARIENSFINFNDAHAANPPAQFDALRLHLAPQKDPSWGSLTAAARKAKLETLLTFLADARGLLDSAGYQNMPLFADLDPHWDLLPVDGGIIGWADATERDTWFANLHEIVDGVSLLSFDQNNLADIASVTAYERSLVLPTKARIGMRSAIGAGNPWANLAAFEAGRELVENTIGPADSVDIDSYIQWRQATDEGSPVIVGPALDALFDFAQPTRPVVVVNVLPSHLYLVRFHTEPGNQKHAREVARFRTPNLTSEMMRIPLGPPPEGERGFWTIERIKD